MITFKEDVFVYPNVIFVRDPDKYIDMSIFTPGKEKSIKDVLPSLEGGDFDDNIDDIADIATPDDNTNTSTKDADNKANDKSTSEDVQSTIIDQTSDKTVYSPTRDDLSLLDKEKVIDMEVVDLKNRVTISNSELMMNAPPLWRLRADDNTNVLHDFEHYKDAAFAIMFSQTIPKDIAPPNVDELFKEKTVNADELHKFTLSYIEIPTEAPYEDDVEATIEITRPLRSKRGRVEASESTTPDTDTSKPAKAPKPKAKPPTKDTTSTTDADTTKSTTTSTTETTSDTNESTSTTESTSDTTTDITPTPPPYDPIYGAKPSRQRDSSGRFIRGGSTTQKGFGDNSGNTIQHANLNGGSKSTTPTRKIPLITFTNLAVLRSTTIYELKEMIAFQLRVNVSNITMRIRDTNTMIYPYTKIINDSKYKWVHILKTQALEESRRYNKPIEEGQTSVFMAPQVDTAPSATMSMLQKPQPGNKTGKALGSADNNVYVLTELTDKTVSVGSSPIIVTIKRNNDSRSNIYEELFYPNYSITANFCNKVIANMRKNNLPKMPFVLNISQVAIRLIYKGPPSAHANINIVKLFNMNHVGDKCSKIYIQSKVLDEYRHNPRPMQYVKVFKQTTNHFKGVDSYYNTCSFYISDQVQEYETNKNTGIIMHHIEINENMNATFVFTNTNMKNSYQYIMDMCSQYIALHAEAHLRRIKINETIYNTEYRYDYYVPVISNITASVTIGGATMTDLATVTEIMNQEIPQNRFSTRSSMYFSAYTFYNLGYWYDMIYLSDAHEFLTTSIIYKDIFPAAHCILNEDTNELTITLSKMSSIENLMFMATMIAGAVAKPSSNVDGDTDFLNQDAPVKLENIRKMAAKYDKKLLKLLTRIDPTLFGPRYIGTKNRSYSGLCQKKEQRPIPLTEHEYNELRKNPELHESLTRLQNQTYQDQHLCLFCADKVYKFLNYHHFPNQKCIVRCTSKGSNKTQYEYCSKDLGAENPVNIQNRYENQTITLYNALITKGRKCRIPEEIKDVLTNYILAKLNIPYGRIDSYCMDIWGKHAFIIQRHMDKSGDIWVCRKYNIKTDYTNEFDYVLILESEGDQSYFAFITEGNNPKPLVFSENEEIKEFFITHVKQTNDNNDFFRHLEKVLNINLGEYSMQPMKTILNALKTRYGLTFIVDDSFIVGVMKNSLIYLTPSLYWYFEEWETKNNLSLFSVGTGLFNSTFKGPDITTLDFKLINAIYMDFGSKRTHMIRYNGHDMFVQPFELTAKYSAIDVIQFDYYAHLHLMMNAGKMYINITGKDDDIRNFEVSNVINTYVYIYLMTHEHISKKLFFRFMAELGAITGNQTYTNYCDKTNKRFMSWRNSKINKDEFLSYINRFLSFNTNELISTNYDILNNEMEFSIAYNEEIDEKIITS